MTPRSPRVCIKVYAESDTVPDSALVPIFHRWIRDRMLDFVFIDVADYAHVPNGPGTMLVTDSITFALDRADGRYGLFAQQRRPVEGDVTDAIALALRQTLAVADALERERSLRGKLRFDRSRVRIEINDRLAAPNDEGAFRVFGPAAVDAANRVLSGSRLVATRANGDARDRLAIDLAAVRP